jgi:hypothetical protein
MTTPFPTSAQDYIRIHGLAGLCIRSGGLHVAHNSNGPVEIPRGTTRVVWCASVAARQLEIEVAKGSTVEAAAAKFGIELFPHERVLIRAKMRALRGLYGAPRPRRV